MGAHTSALVDKPFHKEGTLFNRFCINENESTSKYSLSEIDEDIHSQHEVNKQKLETSGRKSTTSCSIKKKEANKLKKKLSRILRHLNLYQQLVTRNIFRKHFLDTFGIHYQTKLTAICGLPNFSHENYTALLRLGTLANYDGAGQAACGQWTTLPLHNGWPKWPKSLYETKLTVFGPRRGFKFMENCYVSEILTQQTQPMLFQSLSKKQLYAACLSGFSLYKNLTKSTDGLPHNYLNWFAEDYFRSNPRPYNEFPYWFLNGDVTGLTVNRPWITFRTVLEAIHTFQLTEQKMPTPFNGLPKWWFLNRYAVRLTTCSLKKSGMGAHTEPWHTSIGNDLEDQHQEGFSVSPEVEPSLTTLASGDTIATDGITSTTHNQHLRKESKIDLGAPSNCDMGALTRSRSTSINTDLENQLQLIDGNKVLQQNSQKHGIGAFAKSCSTSIHTDLQDQLQVVDGNKVFQLQSVQEVPPELKPPTTNLADEDIIARDGATPLICAYDQHNHTWSVHGNPSKMGLGSLSKLCFKTTDNDLEDQLLVVDGNNILQQSLKEGISTPPELNLASDVIASDGGSVSGQHSVSRKKKTLSQLTSQSSTSQTRKCRSLQPWPREQKEGAVVTAQGYEEEISDYMTPGSKAG